MRARVEAEYSVIMDNGVRVNPHLVQAHQQVAGTRLRSENAVTVLLAGRSVFVRAYSTDFSPR